MEAVVKVPVLSKQTTWSWPAGLIREGLEQSVEEHVMRTKKSLVYAHREDCASDAPLSLSLFLSLSFSLSLSLSLSPSLSPSLPPYPPRPPPPFLRAHTHNYLK